MSCADKHRENEIKILWAKWPPADYLSEIAMQFTQQTGFAVKVVQKSWDGAFGDATFSEFRNRADNYDIIIGDSQWLGLGVVGKHYLDLTDWLPSNVKMDSIEPAAWKWYSEYPKGSKRYFAVPCEADALAWAYRKDLFESPDHQAAFKSFLSENKIADFPLAPPQTWEQLYWIAAYFKKNIPGMSGVVMVTSRNYDMATMSFEQVLWSFGGEFGNYENNKVMIQSPESVKALSFFRKLMETTSDGGKNMSYSEVAAEFIAGRAAMACDFLAFFPALATPRENPDYYNKTGFFNAPGHTDDKGIYRRVVSLGGQGMSINAHISPERQARAKAFLKWFSLSETQKTWAEKGGYTSDKTVLASPTFLKAAPYNPLFADAFTSMKDFWSVPEFDELLKVCQREFCSVFQDNADPVQAIAEIQKEHEAIFNKRAGRK